MIKHQCVTCNLANDLAQASHRTDLRRVVTILLTQIMAQLGVHATDVLIFDADKQLLEYAGGRGFKTRGFENSKARIALAGQVIREGKIVRHTDLQTMQNNRAGSRELTDEGFVTYIGVPLFANDQLKGILEIFHREQFNPNAAWLQSLGEIAQHGANAIATTRMLRHLQFSNTELAGAYDALIDGWARALELREIEPKGHAQRVTDVTVAFARVMGVGEAELIHVRRGAMLHNLGMISLPDNILLRVDSLDEAELKTMKQHPVIAYEQLSRLDYLRAALDIPYCHHEKWDGTGYPRGLAGDQIPLVVRLFSLVDVWDLLRSDRPDRKGWPDAKVHQHIRDRGGKQFDPEFADIFVKLLENGDVRRKKNGGMNEATRGAYDEITFSLKGYS